MLSINIAKTKLWDEINEEFILIDEQTIELEHSLVSLSKWESKWHKPFLNKEEKTTEETLDYIKCMTVTPNVKPEVYICLTNEHMQAINEYIQNPMTATTFSNDKNSKKSREIITSELIYFWMISMQIPVEFENWHLNRLITLIRVCEIKNNPPKKMSGKEIRSRNAALNAARRQQLGTKG